MQWVEGSGVATAAAEFAAVAVAWIQPLAGETPYTLGMAKGKKKRLSVSTLYVIRGKYSK